MIFFSWKKEPYYYDFEEAPLVICFGVTNF